MVHVRACIKSRSSTGLDLPSRTSVFWRPTAKGRVAGPAEVTGEPHKSCTRAEQRSTWVITAHHMSSSSLLHDLPEAINFNNDPRASHAVMTAGYTSGLETLILISYLTLEGSKCLWDVESHSWDNIKPEGLEVYSWIYYFYCDAR